MTIARVSRDFPKLGVPGFKHFRVTKGFTGIDRGHGKENENYRLGFGAISG